MTPTLDPQLDDRAARHRIRTSLAESLLVEASAGTGKTTELVARIVSVLASGATTIDHIVAVTFTNKAAGELKLRLRQELDRARDTVATAQERINIENALEHLEEASVGTIHSFCAQILRERPVEAIVDPAFEELSEPQAARIYERAFRAWIQRKLADGTPALRRALVRLAWRDSFDSGPPIDQLQYAAWKLIEWRDHPAPWRQVAFDRDQQIDQLIEQVKLIAEAASRCPKPTDNLVRSLRPAQGVITWIERAEAANRSAHYETLESLLIKLLRDLKKDTKKGSGFFSSTVPREQVVGARAQLMQNLETFQIAADADLAALLRGEMWDLVESYEALKRRAGKLDFVDLLILARDLVRDKEEVRAYLQKRFTHIFIDEFQDTDPLQAEILLLLASDDAAQSDWLQVRRADGKLFIVGDPKQSIYRFRRADVSLYQGVKQLLLMHGAQLEHLTVSFRATPAIQTIVNAAFAPLMSVESGTQPLYAPLMPYRAEPGTQPSIVVLPVPEPYGNFGRVVNFKIDQSIPEAIAAYARWLVHESGWTVTEREAPDVRVPIRPRHICILFRRMNSFGRDVTRPYLRALEARHLPHVLVKGGSFNEREEVIALRNLLGAIERPDDELTVFAALHGPVFALSDGALLEFRCALGSLRPFRKLPDDIPDSLKEVKGALEVIKNLHRGRNRRPIAETIAKLLAETRAHAGFAIWPTGEQALANI